MSLISFFVDIKNILLYGDLPTSYYVKRGLKVGKNFKRQSGTRLDPSNCWLIEIGDDVIMGNKVQLIAHDFSTMNHTGYARFGKIVIGDRVFIGANSTILMNVDVGNDVIIGAGSLVNKDIPSGYVVAGVPAKIICSTADYVKKQEQFILRAPKYKKADTCYGGRMSKEKKNEIIHAVEGSPDGVFYANFYNTCYMVGGEKKSF